MFADVKPTNAKVRELSPHSFQKTHRGVDTPSWPSLSSQEASPSWVARFGRCRGNSTLNFHSYGVLTESFQRVKGFQVGRAELNQDHPVWRSQSSSGGYSSLLDKQTG